MVHPFAFRFLPATLFAVAIGLSPLQASATSKEECLEAHGKGQDLRAEGRLTSARQAILTCAQSVCPALIQDDCAKMADDLARLTPSVSFGARDGSGDLPNAMVYVDDALITSRLDDGKTYDVDPGKHIVRYVHDGRQTSLTVILAQGEKGRLVVGNFPATTGASSGPVELSAAPPSRGRSAVPLFVGGLGAAAAVAGVVLAEVGRQRMPAECSIDSRECATRPGDPTLVRAESAASMGQAGLGLGIGGASVLVGSLVWYFVQPSRDDSRRAFAIQPYLRF
jgi:hypothetical protein